MLKTSLRNLAPTRVEGSTGPAVGARFEATNKVSRSRPWKNRPIVVAADPGREFAFSRTEKFSGTIIWRYRFEPLGKGTRVTESYEVTRPSSRLGWFVIERLFGGHDRRGDLHRGMQQTLERLRATASGARCELGTGQPSLDSPG